MTDLKQTPSRECVATTLTVAPDTDIYMPGWEPVSITKDDRGNALVLFRRTDLEDRIAKLERELADKQAAIEMNDQDYRKVVRERDEARAERDRRSDDSGDGNPIPEPAAPDPHEYAGGLAISEYCSHISGGVFSGNPPCGRPADDPIHTQSTDDDRQDASPAYVGPGDEVGWDRGDGFIRSGTVVGPRRNAKAQLAIHWFGAAGPVWKLVQDLRTPDGRPVAGFRELKAEERIAELYPGEGYTRIKAADWCFAQDRIAELERELDVVAWHRDKNDRDANAYLDRLEECQRERDEARAERDRLRDD